MCGLPEIEVDPPCPAGGNHCSCEVCCFCGEPKGGWPLSEEQLEEARKLFDELPPITEI
jgi:hypothetical protein